MKNIGCASRYIAFLDECGDHSLDKIDRDFPVFLLALLVVERKHYVEKIIPHIGALKLKYWNHEGINLHSRDIRKTQGPFSFMIVPEKRNSFMQELSEIMSVLEYTLFICAIDKQKHKIKYGNNALNPYNLAVKLNMERVMDFMALHGEKELPVIAEARGKNEDDMLEIEFLRLMSSGTEYISKLSRLACPLVFRSKRDNVAGIQLADLCAHPCARYILKPEQPNKAFDIVKQHIYKHNSVSGWKVFP